MCYQLFVLCNALIILNFYKNPLLVWSVSSIFKKLIWFLSHVCILLSWWSILVASKSHNNLTERSAPSIPIIILWFLFFMCISLTLHVTVILMVFVITELTFCIAFPTWILRDYFLLSKQARMLNYDNFHITNILNTFYIVVLLYSYIHLTIPQFLKTAVKLSYLYHYFVIPNNERKL